MKLTPMGEAAAAGMFWFVLVAIVMFSGYPWLAGIMVWLGVPTLTMVYLVLVEEKENMDK